MIMFEACVKLPKFLNDGKTSTNEVLQDVVIQACKTFGGCSVSEVQGSWVSPEGKLYQEPVNDIIIAMESNRENDQKLKDIAEYIKTSAFQESVYVRYASGNVDFL